MKDRIKGVTKREFYFTKTEAQQIRDMIHTRQRDGWYYGNKRQFIIREMHIDQKLARLTMNGGN